MEAVKDLEECTKQVEKDKLPESPFMGPQSKLKLLLSSPNLKLKLKRGN